MPSDHGLSEKTLIEIHRILDRHPEIESAVLFGSRAKGNYRQGSDIDLALSGATATQKTLRSVDTELEDSDLPYRFSLLLMDGLLDPDVRAHIDRVGQVFYQRNQAKNIPQRAIT